MPCIRPSSADRPAAVQQKGFELHAKHTESNHQVGTGMSADVCTKSRCMCRPMCPSIWSTGCPDEHTCKGPCWTGSWGRRSDCAGLAHHNSPTNNARFTCAYLMQRASLKRLLASVHHTWTSDPEAKVFCVHVSWVPDPTAPTQVGHHQMCRINCRGPYRPMQW